MSYSWFRTESSIADHPKVLRLEALLGDNALAYVTRLHCWTHRYAPSGKFNRDDEPLIEAFCKWKGEPGNLIRGLIVAGLCEDGRRTRSVHDWDEFQGKLVEKSSRDAEVKRKRREERRARGAETARAGRADGARTLRDETDETRRTRRSLDAPVVTPAISAAVAASPARGETNWGLVGEQLADWMRKQRAVAGNFTADRESDVAAVHGWALAWCLKHEPDDRVLDQMREAFNGYLSEAWAIERDCALSLWSTENVWLPRWNDVRAKEAA